MCVHKCECVKCWLFGFQGNVGLKLIKCLYFITKILACNFSWWRLWNAPLGRGKYPRESHLLVLKGDWLLILTHSSWKLLCDYRKSHSSPAHFQRDQVAHPDISEKTPKGRKWWGASFLMILIAYFFLLITYGLVGHDMCMMFCLLWTNYLSNASN